MGQLDGEISVITGAGTGIGSKGRDYYVVASCLHSETHFPGVEPQVTYHGTRSR